MIDIISPHIPILNDVNKASVDVFIKMPINVPYMLVLALPIACKLADRGD